MYIYIYIQCKYIHIKVNHARDAEARAKVLARQAELKAGNVEQQLDSLETKLKQVN